MAVSQGLSINIPPTVADDGTVLFGTWGVLRSYGSDDRFQWHKYDGAVHAVDADLADAWDEPYPGHLVPYCYEYDGRTDPLHCPDGGAANTYNGTVEGTAALSADQSVVYVGRGDGKLYALDPATGAAIWDSPFDPEQHGTGGSFMGLAIDAEGVVYTSVSGLHEEGHVFALDPDGDVLWAFVADDLFEWSHPVLGPQGHLYFAESSRSLCIVQPIESGACDGEDLDPVLYVIRSENGGAGDDDTGDDDDVSDDDDSGDDDTAVDDDDGDPSDDDDAVQRPRTCMCTAAGGLDAQGVGVLLFALLLAVRRARIS